MGYWYAHVIEFLFQRFNIKVWNIEWEENFFTCLVTQKKRRTRTFTHTTRMWDSLFHLSVLVLREREKKNFCRTNNVHIYIDILDDTFNHSTFLFFYTPSYDIWCGQYNRTHWHLCLWSTFSSKTSVGKKKNIYDNFVTYTKKHMF